jgi:hypothetical protein
MEGLLAVWFCSESVLLVVGAASWPRVRVWGPCAAVGEGPTILLLRLLVLMG